MKTLYLLVIAMMSLHFYTYGEALRVNNQFETDPTQRLFSSIQEAHDAATPGDTLMIEGSPLEYESVGIEKRLVIIGTGYFLTENSQTSANPLTSTVRQIRLLPGSEGTVLIGLSFSRGFNTYAPYVETSDIVIMRCFITSSIQFVGNLQNIKILQNFFEAGTIGIGFNSYTFSDVELINNVIRNNMAISPSNQRIFSKVDHNMFLGDVILRTSTFRNNILASSTAQVDIDSQNIQNNLSLGAQLSGAGNQTYNDAQLFTGVEGNSTDGQYQLKPDSPYLRAGFEGTEPGIFGGSTPYVLSGLPPIPVIYEFAADGFGTQQHGISIRIKAKTNL